MLSAQQLSHNAKKTLAKGVAAAAAILVTYLIVVLVTTPNLPADAAIRAAFGITPLSWGNCGCQALGQAIVGERTGYMLERVPFDVAYWENWNEINPDTKVLTRDTGWGRPYGADPHGNYYTSPSIYFPVSNHDDRLDPKEMIVGLDYESVYPRIPTVKNKRNMQ